MGLGGWPILSIITLLPAVGALFIMLAPGDSETAGHRARQIALIVTLIDLVLSFVLWANFDTSTAEFQFVESAGWLGGGINYKMGVDGISVLFVVLTALLMPICIVASEAIHARIREYIIERRVLGTSSLGDS